MKQRSPKLLIFLTIFIDLLGFGIIIPILSPISIDYTHGDYKWAQIAVLMSIYSILQMIFSPIWGKLSDRVGRRPILLLSLAGSTTSYFIFGFAWNYWILLLGRAIGGICAANITAAQAYIADITPPEERTKGMGLIGMAFGMGFAFGPALGAGAARLSDHWMANYPPQLVPGLLAATICGVNFLWALRSLPESLPIELRAKPEAASARREAHFSQLYSSLGHPTVGPLILVFFLLTFAFSNLEVSMGLYVKLNDAFKWEPKQIYSLFIYVGLLLAFVQGYVIRKAVKFVPETILVIIGAFAQAAALAIFPMVPALWCILLSLALVAFGQGISLPSLLAIVSKSTDPRRQGEVMGVTQLASALARIMGPVAAMGMVYVGNRAMGRPREDPGGLHWPFWLGAVGMLLGGVMAIVVRRRIIALGGSDVPPAKAG